MQDQIGHHLARMRQQLELAANAGDKTSVNFHRELAKFHDLAAARLERHSRKR